MENDSPDVFVAFHISNARAREFAQKILSAIPSTYIWPVQTSHREQWKELESERLRRSRIVVVLLGEQGWGPYHLALTLEAKRLKKPIIPVLTGLPPAGARDRVTDLAPASNWYNLRGDEPGPINALIDSIQALLLEQKKHRVVAAGFSPDIVDANIDHLGSYDDARSLIAVLLAKDVRPPLAIGLFGDWGTGKSFLMEAMRLFTDQLSAKAKRESHSPFCSNVVSIKFNAWHYADSNLWASLVSHILDQLAAHVAPTPKPEDTLSALAVELESAKEVKIQADSELARIKNEILGSRAKLKEIEEKRHVANTSLRAIKLSDLHTILTQDEALKKRLSALLIDVGAPTVLRTMVDLHNLISEVNTFGGRLRALLKALFSPPQIWIATAFLILIFVAPLIVQGAEALGFLYANQKLVELVAMASGAIALGRKSFAYAGQRTEQLRVIYNQLQQEIAKRRGAATSKEAELEKELVGLSSEEQEISARINAATNKVIELEQMLQPLKDGRRLVSFILDRTKSHDYRRHLGLISTIRRDFDDLMMRLDAASREPADNLERIDRIILYIDDLDRCPTDKVVEILQAVHLLLAYPLFVVVVGVDPRWLLHSLTEKFTAFSSSSDGATDAPDVWATTPQNYLEKIFQISINVSPMTKEGYATYIWELFSSQSQSAAEAPQSAQDFQEGPIRSPSESIPQESIVRSQAPILEETIIITTTEMAFAERLFSVFKTPRSVKRFSNIYRIIKASIAPAHLPEFEGTEEKPGTFQVPMMLLALLVGNPSIAARVFGELYLRSKKDVDLHDNLIEKQILGISRESFGEVAQVISATIDSPAFPREAKLFREWLPKISRFSFDIGRSIPPT